jgi:uncharacterized membrane protein
MDTNDIISAVQSDYGLTNSQKEELMSDETKRKIQTFLSGAGGAALALAVSKYLKLGKTSKVILSTLGFGAGVLLYKHYTSTNKFATYDEKTKRYQIDTKKF